MAIGMTCLIVSFDFLTVSIPSEQCETNRREGGESGVQGGWEQKILPWRMDNTADVNI